MSPDPPLLLLASASPRRRDLLEKAGIAFARIAPGPEPEGTGGPVARAEQRAVAKARGAAVPRGRNGLVLGVDTIVEIDGEELGKPVDPKDAERMLRKLSGREHRVHTAHCLWDPVRDESLQELATAVVAFRELTRAELDSHVAGGTWRGKAGAYGIQDPETEFATLKEGACDTVVGLHVATVRRLITALSGG